MYIRGETLKMYSILAFFSVVASNQISPHFLTAQMYALFS